MKKVKRTLLRDDWPLLRTLIMCPWTNDLFLWGSLLVYIVESTSIIKEAHEPLNLPKTWPKGKTMLTHRQSEGRIRYFLLKLWSLMSEWMTNLPYWRVFVRKYQHFPLKKTILVASISVKRWMGNWKARNWYTRSWHLNIKFGSTVSEETVKRGALFCKADEKPLKILSTA